MCRSVGCGHKFNNLVHFHSIYPFDYPFAADSMSALQEFEPALMSALNTAHSQPAQIPTVCEGVYAAVLLLRLLRSDMMKGWCHQSWKNILSNIKISQKVNYKVIR